MESKKDQRYILTFMGGSKLGPLRASEISDQDHEDALIIETEEEFARNQSNTENG